jgi:recombination protein RecA
MVLGENEMPPVSVIPTGSIVLDEALGVGGFPRGRITEIYGPESSGKTSVALTAVGIAQKMGLKAAFVDAEHAFDPEWAAVLGVDTPSLIVSQPDYGEQGLQIAEKLACTGEVGIIVIDSVAALVPKAELEGEIGDVHVGLQARMMSQALRILTPKVAEKGTAVLFINQLREKVGVFFGNKETQAGGKALKFYASVRLDVRRTATIKVGTEPVGSKVRVKAVKNKVARPFGVAEFDFLFGHGISREGELIDLAVERGVVAAAGSWYFLSGEKTGGTENKQLAQGRENLRQLLTEDAGLFQAVETAVRANPAPHKVSAGAKAAAGQLDLDGEAPWDKEE